MKIVRNQILFYISAAWANTDYGGFQNKVFLSLTRNTKSNLTVSAGFSSITESTDKSDTIAETSREVKSTQLKLRSLPALTNEQLKDAVSFVSGSILLDSCNKRR